MLKVVDLGTKLGNAIVEFCKKGDMYFGEDVKTIRPEQCLGIDRQSRYTADLVQRGFQFQDLDVTAPGALDLLPEADYYLAWDFLEHLPNKEWSTAIVKVMLHKARRGVWLRMPSFEQDEETGEGVLRKHGMRFAWTDWVGHPSPYLVQDAVVAIESYNKEHSPTPYQVRIRPGKLLRSTEDNRIVPISAPTDTVTYVDSLGFKPVLDFNPAIVGQWEVVVNL